MYEILIAGIQKKQRFIVPGIHLRLAQWTLV